MLGAGTKVCTGGFGTGKGFTVGGGQSVLEGK
jgi:hypothetical protein